MFCLGRLIIAIWMLKGTYSLLMRAAMISSSDVPFQRVFRLPIMSASISSGELTGRSTSSMLGGETKWRPCICRGAREMKKGCVKISGICSLVRKDACLDIGHTVIRVSGSFSSIRFKRSLAGSLISLGISNTPTFTFCKSERILSSSNGSRPVRRANSIIPQDQISDEDPW